jgi:xanthine dehydrogenase accessory factor
LLGGAADAALADAALLAAAPGLVDIPIADDPAVAAGLACGGLARILVQDVDAVPAGWWEALAGRRPATLVTDLGTGVSTVGEPEGRESATTIDGDRVTETHWPVTHVLVVGEASLATAIRRQAALLGWTASVGTDVAALGPVDAAVVLTHDPAVAIPVLAAALQGAAGYVGALGSRSTQANRRIRLLAEGLDDATIDRIHGPVGLDLGGRTPEETALSICAEILAVRSGGSAVSLRDTSGPINR